MRHGTVLTQCDASGVRKKALLYGLMFGAKGWGLAEMFEWRVGGRT